MKLNLGAGRNVLDGWINVDRQQLPGVDVVFDLDGCRLNPFPFDGNSVDQILLSHILEHLHHPLPLMAELHRVAKNGAIMEIRVPHDSHNRAWADQTHVRAYNEESFGYFSQPHYHSADYGYRGDWKCEKIIFISKHKYFPDGLPGTAAMVDVFRTYRNLVDEMIAHMVAVKPIGQAGREYMDRPSIAVHLVEDSPK